MFFELPKERTVANASKVPQELSRALKRGAKAEVALAAIYEENEQLKARFNLMLQATSDGLWDMETNQSNWMDANNPFWWSDQFRSLLGFADESDFPNLLGGWSSRLHPNDAMPTLAAFAAHINDLSGKIPYDVEYRLLCSNGEYRWFSARGKTMRTKRRSIGFRRSFRSNPNDGRGDSDTTASGRYLVKRLSTLQNRPVRRRSNVGFFAVCTSMMVASEIRYSQTELRCSAPAGLVLDSIGNDPC